MRWKQAVSRRVILDLCPKLNTGYVAQCVRVPGCDALRRALGIMRSRGSIPATADQEMQVQVLLWPNIFPFLSFLSQFSQMIGTFDNSVAFPWWYRGRYELSKQRKKGEYLSWTRGIILPTPATFLLSEAKWDTFLWLIISKSKHEDPVRYNLFQ